MIKKFLNIEIEEPPVELELSVEMRCRDIMESDDIDNVKRYCTHLVRHQMKQDVFLASVLGRLVELEAAVTCKAIRKRRSGFKLLLWHISQLFKKKPSKAK